MLDRWLPVVGYEGLYEVSDHGKVIAVARLRPDGRMYCARTLGQSIQNGYPCVSLYRGKAGKRVYVHRIVAQAFLGSCPDGFEVNHKDGNKQNPCADNLEWTSRSENQLHAVRMGLRPRRTSGAFVKGNVPWNKGYLAENKLLPTS